MKDNKKPVCKCGDYKEDHEGKNCTGKCMFATHVFSMDGCKKYRFSHYETPQTER